MFTEESLMHLGLRQGIDWSYCLEDGKMQPAVSLSGLLKLTDRCAAEQGWSSAALADQKADLARIWRQEHGHE